MISSTKSDGTSVFQSLEKSRQSFPIIGKIAGKFSNHWKIGMGLVGVFLLTAGDACAGVIKPYQGLSWSAWEEVQGLPAGRQDLSAAAWDGCLYAVAGNSQTNVYRFDGTNWAETVGLPSGNGNVVAVNLHDSLYAFGGNASNTYLFDGANWNFVTKMPNKPINQGSAVLGGLAYSVAGAIGVAPITNVYAFDGTNWSQAVGVSEASQYPVAGVLSNRLYVAGGYGPSWVYRTNMYRLEDTVWTLVEPLPPSAGHSRLAAVTLEGLLYAIGGQSAAGYRTNVFAYNGTTWTESVGLPGPRSRHAAATFNGQIYVLSGFTGAGTVTNVYRYPGTITYQAVDPASGSYTGGYSVIIRGENLGDGSDITNVTLCGVSVASIDNQSATQILVTAASAPTGLGDVRVYSVSFGETVTSNAFTYTASGMTVLGTNGVAIANGEAASADKGTRFGLYPVGSEPAHVFVVTNSGDEALIITGITSSIPEFSASPSAFAEIQPGHKTNLTIHFTPTSVGEFGITLVMTNNSPDSPFQFNLYGSCFDVTPFEGPLAGGNVITVSIANSGDITNVLIGVVSVTPTTSDTNGFTVTLPAASTNGGVNITVQTSGHGEIVLEDAYYYNPSGQIGNAGVVYQWEEVAGMPTGLLNHASVTYNGRIYVMGGQTTNNGAVPATNLVYCHDGTNWMAAPSMPAGRMSFGATVLDGKIYVIGGLTNRMVGSQMQTNVFVFDGTNWAESVGLPKPTANLSAGALDGKLYIAGGETNLWDATTNAYSFDGTNWTPVAGLPAPRMQMAYANWSNSMIVAGGYYSPSSRTNTWSFDGISWAMNYPGLTGNYEFNVGAGAVVDGLFYVIVGDVMQVRVFNGANWSTVVNYPQNPEYLSSASLGGQVYGMGGSYSTTAFTNVYRYPTFWADPGVAPLSGSWTGGYQVVINGENLCNTELSDVTNVTLCGVPATVMGVSGRTQIVVTAGTAASIGFGEIRVYSTSYGETVRSNAFTYTRENQAPLVFNPTSPQAVSTTNALSVSGGSGTGAVSYAVLSGPGTIVDGTNVTVTAESGTIVIRASKAQDDLYFAASVTGTITAVKAMAQVYLQDLSQLYDGTARNVTATTDPSGLTVEFTYDGNAWAPTNIGSYAVTGTVNDAEYGGSAAGTLVVSKGTAGVYLSGVAQTYNGTARSVTATSDPAGLTIEFTYDGNAWAPTNAGSYAVTGTVNDANWQGSSNATLVVSKAAAGVYLSGLAQAYDGTARSVTATSDPSGLTVEFTYDGNAWAPTNAGSYAVTGTVNDANWEGSADGTLAVSKGTAGVYISGLVQTYDGTARSVTATSDPAGLTIEFTYDGNAWAPTNAGSYAVTGTVNDANWQGSADGSLVVSKGTAGVSLADLSQTYDGLAKSVTATSDPAGLTVEFTYDGNAWAPTNAGSYAVTGTVNDANWEGSTDGTLVVSKGTADVYLSGLAQTYDGTARSVTATSDPAGLTIEFTYDGNAWAPTNVGSYAVTGTVNDANWQGNASGTLVVNPSGPVTRQAVQSGPWDDPATWGGTLPAPGDHILIPDSFTVTLTNSPAGVGNLTILGTLTVVGAPTIQIGGSFTNAGAFNPGSGTVEFIGGGNSEMIATTPGSLTFYNLKINKANSAGTITARSKVKVTRKLTITRGKLVSASDYADILIETEGTLELTSDISVAGDFVIQGGGTLSTAGYKITFDGGTNQNLTMDALVMFDDLTVGTNTTLIETEPADNVLVNGTLLNKGVIRKLQTLDAGEFYYFGLAGSYADADMEIRVTDRTGGDPLTAIQVDRMDANHPHAPGTNTSDIYWTITPAGADFTADITLPQDGLSDPLVCRYQSSAWDWARSAFDLNTVTRTNLTAFGDFATFNYPVLGYAEVTIESAHGSTIPVTGVYTMLVGTVFTNQVQTPDTQGTTQYVCTGWAATENLDPAGGSGTQAVVTVNGTGTLTWQWTTEYYLTPAARPHGSIDRIAGWFTNGALVEINATADQYYHFTNWTGSVLSYGNPLNLLMDEAKWVTANFAENWTTNNPTPEWWLAQYGITNDQEEAVGEDPDNDGIPTGDEWTMNTDPTNASSYLFMAEMENVYGNCHDVITTNAEPPYDVVTQVVCEVAGQLLGWPCATDRVYDVQYDLPGGWTPVDGMTNLAPAGAWLVVTNTPDGSALRFYRLRVQVPE